MKLVILFIGLFQINAYAQINLDKPVMVGLGDQIYEAVNDPGWYYFFPKELCRTNESTITQQGVRLFADFNVSLCEVQIEKVKAQLVAKGIQNPQVRVFRGLETSITAMSLQDAFGSYDPKIEVLGDAGDFATQTPYRLSLYSGSRNRSIRRASSVMDQLFGPESVDAFVQVGFEFTSIFAGQTRASKSAVSVYIGRGPMKPNPTQKRTSLWPSAQAAEVHATSAIPNVEEDSLTHCWVHPTPGVICLR